MLLTSGIYVISSLQDEYKHLGDRYKIKEYEFHSCHIFLEARLKVICEQQQLISNIVILLYRMFGILICLLVLTPFMPTGISVLVG